MAEVDWVEEEKEEEERGKGTSSFWLRSAFLYPLRHLPGGGGGCYVPQVAGLRRRGGAQTIGWCREYNHLSMQ